MSNTDHSKRRRPRSPSPEYKLDDVDDSYEPYVPVAQRRQAKLAKLSTLGVNSEKSKAKQLQEDLDEKEDAQREEERRREKARKERTLLLEAQEVHLKKATEGEEFSTFCMEIFDQYMYHQTRRRLQEKKHKRLMQKSWKP